MPQQPQMQMQMPVPQMQQQQTPATSTRNVRGGMYGARHMNIIPESGKMEEMVYNDDEALI